MRKTERKDTIKPALSIQFISVRDEMEEEHRKILHNIFRNNYGFAFSPIFETFASYGVTYLSGYFPKIGVVTPFIRQTSLLFKIHVDGSFPVTDIKATEIHVTKKSDEGFISSNRIISIGYPVEKTDSLFDFYHKHQPKNFERLDNLAFPMPVDTKMFNKYISPNEDMYIEVPVRIGVTRLTNLIKLIMNDEEFSKKENLLDVDYPFDNPKALNNFLTNLSSFPIQTTITFEYSDIDNNVYHKNVQCFTYLKIEKIDDGTDFIITPSVTTSGYITHSTSSDVLEEFIDKTFNS